MWRLDEHARAKYRAADELGLTAALLGCGWPGLSARDTGRIGALVRRHHHCD